MKSKLFTLALLSVGLSLSAQVGINTDQPQATLDVMGSPSDVNKLDGIIAPRLTGGELKAKNYKAAQTGAVVYVTVTETAPTGQTVDVTTPGYYYFDGAKWVSFVGWRTIGNSDNEISTVAEILGTSPASRNYLGTKGSADDLVIASGSKTHAVLNTTGGLNGGGETTSSLTWGFNNANNITGSITLNSPNNASYGTTAQGRSVTAVNAANIILGRDNIVASINSNFPSIAIGKNNVVSNGGRAIGTDNYAMSPASYLIGNGNVAYTTGVGGYMFGLANEGSGYNFGAGTKTAVNSIAIGISANGNAKGEGSAAGALYFGMQGGVALSNETLYSNHTHVFATNTDSAGNPIASVATGNPYSKIGVNVIPNETAADLQISKAILIKSNTAPSAGGPCSAAEAGTIMYGVSGTTGNFFGCKQLNATVYQWVTL